MLNTLLLSSCNGIAIQYFFGIPLCNSVAFIFLSSMIHRLRSLQWKNILLIIVVTIFSEYLIELVLFGHVIGSGYTVYSVLLHIVYYLAIPSIIVASELWKRQAKKLVQYLALIVPTLIHVVLHVVPFLQLLHLE